MWAAWASTAWAIVGGTPVQTAMDPVVAVVRDGTPICTGTLLHPEWVLTAGHCVDDGPTAVWWGTDLRDGDPALAIDVAETVTDPDRDGREHDVALIRLAEPSSGTLAILGAPPAVGDEVRAVGFGATADGADDAGTKRAAALDVLDLGPVVVTTYRGGSNLCSGDSGAPLIRPDTVPIEVVAVGTFVDPTCLGGAAGGSRSDAIAAFVAEHVPESDGPWELPDTGVEDPSPPADGCAGSGCLTVPGGGAGGGGSGALFVGWLILAWGVRGGIGRSRLACDKTTA